MQATVSHVVKSILSTSFIIGFATVVFNLKSRFCKENAWQVRACAGLFATSTSFVPTPCMVVHLPLPVI